MTILQFRQRCAAVRFFLVNIAAGCSKTSSPAGMTVKLRCSVVHKIGLPPAVSQPASISLSRSWGISWGNLLAKKNALPLLQETKRLQTLCGTTLLAVPLRAAAPHCPPSRADAVTGITRPRLLMRRLSAGGSKVIFPLRPSPPYTVRRLSWLGPQGYSSLSTPYDSILALSYHVFSVCQIKFLKITPPADRPRGSGPAPGLRGSRTNLHEEICIPAARRILCRDSRCSPQ